MALTSLLNHDLLGGSELAGSQPVLNLPPKVKRVIFLSMAGGPSHLETFDYKPELEKMHGKPMPSSFTEGQPIAQLQGQQLKCQGPMTKFKKYGANGQTISDLFLFHKLCIEVTAHFKSESISLTYISLNI